MAETKHVIDEHGAREVPLTEDEQAQRATDAAQAVVRKAKREEQQAKQNYAARIDALEARVAALEGK